MNIHNTEQQARSVGNIRRGGANDMKGHYFTKLVTEQWRLGGRSWPRKDNLVVRGRSPGIF